MDLEIEERSDDDSCVVPEESEFQLEEILHDLDALSDSNIDLEDRKASVLSIIDEWETRIKETENSSLLEEIRERVVLVNNLNALNSAIEDPSNEIPPIKSISVSKSHLDICPDLNEGEIEITAVQWENAENKRRYFLYPYVYSLIKLGNVQQVFWSPQAKDSTHVWDFSIKMSVPLANEEFHNLLAKTKIEFVIYNKIFLVSSQLCSFKIPLSPLNQQVVFNKTVKHHYYGTFSFRFRVRSPAKPTYVKEETNRLVFTQPIDTLECQTAYEELLSLYESMNNKAEALLNSSKADKKSQQTDANEKVRKRPRLVLTFSQEEYDEECKKRKVQIAQLIEENKKEEAREELEALKLFIAQFKPK